MDLADAVNDAFARWDRAHLSVFTLADGRVVTDEETGAEMAGSIGGPIRTPLDIEATKVARVLDPGAEFQFTFDLGDNWTHRCVVGEEKIDPLEVLGIRPDRPLPYWGWGSIPDQCGRRWAADDGASRPPRKPAHPHPMLLHAWPAHELVPELDLSELRAAIAAADADRFLAAVTGRDIDDVLQQVGAGIPMALDQRREQTEPVALSVINRLTMRAGPGDQVLADDLLAWLRREPLKGRVVPVDLEMLCTELEGDPSMSTGGYLDLDTGDVYGETATDATMVGEDAAIDVEEEPDRWPGSIAPVRGRDGGTWRPLPSGSATPPCGRGWNARSRARAPSADSATWSARRTSPTDGTPSRPTANWAAPANSSTTKASAWAGGPALAGRSFPGRSRLSAAAASQRGLVEPGHVPLLPSVGAGTVCVAVGVDDQVEPGTA